MGLGLQDAYEGKNWLITIIGFSISLLCIFGIFITTRHRILFSDKMRLIINIENHMDLPDNILPKWKKVKFNVSYLMMIIYALLSISAGLYAIVGGILLI
jgi:hypothetical protein